MTFLTVFFLGLALILAMILALYPPPQLLRRLSPMGGLLPDSGSSRRLVDHFQYHPYDAILAARFRRCSVGENHAITAGISRVH
ncbi:MAG TPA: hypothetical protein VN452_05560 [Longilinea sp.]|nr:hypothetical protein [Longilinea sp.]